MPGVFYQDQSTAKKLDFTRFCDSALYTYWSKKQKGSKNREKAKLKLAKACEKLKNQRDDFLHKLSRAYIENNDLIAIEKLNISGMAKNRHLPRKILDASWECSSTCCPISPRALVGWWWKWTPGAPRKVYHGMTL